MNNKIQHYILYVIIAVVMATIAIQAYWNYKNYQNNKKQLVIDVQTSLDKAVDDYYTTLAKEATFNFGSSGITTVENEEVLKKISASLEKSKVLVENLESLNSDGVMSITIMDSISVDTIIKPRIESEIFIEGNTALDNNKIQIFNTDTLTTRKNLELLASKLLLSLKNNDVNLKRIDTLLQEILLTKNIKLSYDLEFNKPKANFTNTLNNTNTEYTSKQDSTSVVKLLQVESKSEFLPKGSTLAVRFKNANWVALKKGISALSISATLVLAVLGCLLFLLRIIRSQKQLAEVKNDLISNITHEFKTPIATISAALEAINNFNVIDDKAKTKKYVEISAGQLSKLTLMVEKLLETATLDSETLKFNKEPLNITVVLENLVNGYKTQHLDKIFHFNANDINAIVLGDEFHLENALNNILDNAVKYGGPVINVAIENRKNQLYIAISDNGNTLKKENTQQIFEKFYRIPKGNTHDIKGYGIGLYYTKTVINKHEGTIMLELSKNTTTFKILLPNA